MKRVSLQELVDLAPPAVQFPEINGSEVDHVHPLQTKERSCKKKVSVIRINLFVAML